MFDCEHARCTIKDCPGTESAFLLGLLSNLERQIDTCAHAIKGCWVETLSKGLKKCCKQGRFIETTLGSGHKMSGQAKVLVAAGKALHNQRLLLLNSLLEFLDCSCITSLGSSCATVQVKAVKPYIVHMST